MNIDITERKRAEEALQKAHDELELRVNERTAELTKANERLRHEVEERKRAEDALRQSEEKYRTLLETSPDAVIMTDLQGHITYASQRTLEMHGSERLEELVGRNPLDFFAPEDHEKFLANRQRNTEAGVLHNLEYTFLKKDGTRFAGEASAAVFRDVAGNPTGFVSIIRDITERKVAEEALRESEERFRVTFEEAPVGMVIGVGDGVIVKANRALCHMIGHSKEELVGRHVRDFTHPDDRELSGPFVERLMAGEIPSFTLEKRYLRKDGQLFWAQATTAAIRGQDGKMAFALGVVEDITDRKRAEEVLRQSERRFRNYFEQGLIGMAVTSVDKRWLEVNDRLCEILGYSREELHQKTWAELTYPDDLEPNFQLFNRLLTGEIEHFTLNKRYLKKDGSIVHTTIHTRAFRKEDGTIDHVVTLVEDITARREAEETLRNREYQLRNVLDTNPSIIFVKDRDSKILLGNEALARFYGTTLQQIVGTLHTDLHARLGMSPQEITQWLADDRVAIDTGITQVFEERATWKDGSVHWYHTTKLQIALPSGRPGVLVVSEDITERKQAEEALHREHRTLKHMLEASDHERQLIAYDIHDGLAQELAGAIMQFQIYAHAQKANPKDAAKAFDTGMAMLQQSHGEARRLISGVRPPILDESGVVAAIVHLVYDPVFEQGSKIDFRNRVKFKRLAPILENVIYRIVQEGLTNARNHSKSKEIRVSLKQRGDRLRIEIRDWGVGFDPKIVQDKHFGLEGICERARLLGGKCNIKSKPGEGTSIVVELPVVERQQEE